MSSFVVSVFRACLTGIVVGSFCNNVIAQQSLMVLGDAVVAGQDRPSFRQPLLDLLSTQGCTVDMVGDQALNSYNFKNPDGSSGIHLSGFDPSLGYDTQHQGFLGITTEQLLKGVAENELIPGNARVRAIGRYIEAHQPDYVLVHLGSHDLELAIMSGVRTKQQVADWAARNSTHLMDIVKSVIASHQNPGDLKVLVANVVPNHRIFTERQATVSLMYASNVYAELIEKKIRALADKRVVLVDVASGFDATSGAMTVDGVIPNANGEEHIAAAFLSMLKQAGLCQPPDVFSASLAGSGSLTTRPLDSNIVQDRSAAISATTPRLISPAPGSVLSGSTMKLNWIPNSTDVIQWYVRVGSTSGGEQYLDSGRITNAATRSLTVTGLPTNGSQVFVEFSYKITTGVWRSEVVSYTASDSGGTTTGGTTGGSTTGSVGGSTTGGATGGSTTGSAGGATKPQIISPAPGSVLSSSTMKLNWKPNTTDVIQWYVRVGSTSGGVQYLDSGRITNAATRSLTVSGLPTNGSRVFVEFSYKLVTGNWRTEIVSYTAASGSGGSTTGGTTGSSTGAGTTGGTATGGGSDSRFPQITGPAPGVSANRSSITLTWDAKNYLVTEWHVHAGSSIGAENYFNSGSITNAATRSLRVTGLPANGSQVHISLYYKNADGLWCVEYYRL